MVLPSSPGLAGVSAQTVMLGAGLLLLVHGAVLRGLGDPSALPAPSWLAGLVLLDIIEPVFAWWLYHQIGGGSRRLADPRSATHFVFTVLGGAALLSASTRTLLAWVLGVDALDGNVGRLFAEFYLDRALGMLILSPPLLVLVTPWLQRQGYLKGKQLADRASDGKPRSENGAFTRTDSSIPRIVEGDQITTGDWVEIIGLAIGASILCMILGALQGRGDLLGWQLWGVQLLLIVWASLRQGLRGGTLVAATATSAALFLPFVVQSDNLLFRLLLEAHLLALCSTAVLVAAAASWVSMQEKGYRQIVSHIPVVIYRVRLAPRRGSPSGGVTESLDRSEPTAPSFLHGTSFAGAEITLVSAASSQLLGCPAEGLLGDYGRWLAIVHPDDREVVFAAVEQLARQEQPVTCEYRVKTVDAGSWNAKGEDPLASTPLRPRPAPQPLQEIRWLRDTLAPQRDSEGRLLGWDGIVTDVSEQRALADDLRRTTSMFNALVGNLPTGVFFVQGPHGQPILVNARARQLLGQREDFSAGLDNLPQVYRLFRADGSLFPAQELPVYLALREGRTSMRDDIVVHRPDGRRVPLVTWAAPVQLGTRDGPNAAVWVLEDLTALRQAEAAREDSEGRLRAVVETMAEGLLVHDAKGVIVTCNPAACAFFSLPAEKLRDRTVFELGWQFLREDGAPLFREEHPSERALRRGHPVRNFILGAQTRGRFSA